MAVARSPFHIVENFLSPKICESIVDDLGFYSPDVNNDGTPIKMFRFNQKAEELIFDRFRTVIPEIIEYYQTEYRGTEQIVFEFHSQGVEAEPICENSDFVRKKWMRTKDRDLTSVIFLSDYNDNPPFDNDYEVYGGKLEYPQHGFGFLPQRGTMITYPSGPHFINANADIIAGDLYQARIHVATQSPYLYQPSDFPGDYTSWF